MQAMQRKRVGRAAESVRALQRRDSVLVPAHEAEASGCDAIEDWRDADRWHVSRFRATAPELRDAMGRADAVVSHD